MQCKTMKCEIIYFTLHIRIIIILIHIKTTMSIHKNKKLMILNYLSNNFCMLV